MCACILTYTEKRKKKDGMEAVEKKEEGEKKRRGELVDYVICLASGSNR